MAQRRTHNLTLDIPTSKHSTEKETNGILRCDDKEFAVQGEDDFERLAKLGSGPFGAVCKVRHKLSNLVFAVKELCGVDEKVATLTREVSILTKSKDSCPFIVRYFGFHQQQVSVGLIMELMRCSVSDMYKTVQRKQLRFPEELLGTIAASILAGLDFLLYEKKIVHRDIKPTNILLGFDGTVKLCDFGVSKDVLRESMLHESRIDRITRTSCYTAPERFSNPMSCFDARSDVWSVGITMVELACLESPYGDVDNFMALMALVLHGPVPTIPDNLDYPLVRSFAALCLKMEIKDRPYYRPPSESAISLSGHPLIATYQESRINIVEWLERVEALPEPDP